MLSPEVLFWCCGLHALAADSFTLGCLQLRFKGADFTNDH